MYESLVGLSIGNVNWCFMLLINSEGASNTIIC